MFNTLNPNIMKEYESQKNNDDDDDYVNATEWSEDAWRNENVKG